MTARNNARRYKDAADKPESPAAQAEEKPAYTIDLTGLTWGDVKMLLQYDGRLTREVIDLADRVVVGGVDSLPFFATVNDVFDAIWAEINKQKDPEAPVARKRKN